MAVRVRRRFWSRGFPVGVALIVLALGSFAPRAAASTAVDLSASDGCGSYGSASGTLVAYYDGWLLNNGYVDAGVGQGCSSDVKYASAGLYVGSVNVAGAATFVGYDPDSGNFFTSGTGVAGRLSLTVSDNFESSTTYGAYVSQPSTPGTLTLGSHSGIAYDQADVTVGSEVCDWSSANRACEGAAWTLTQQQLNPSGGVLATHAYPLTVSPGGTATWTSGNQQAGYAYRYTASVADHGTTYTTTSVLFPVAGTPTVGSITSTGALVSWPAVDGASPYTFGWWYTDGGSWPGTRSPASGTGDTVTGLSPNNDYTVGIAASTPDGGPAWAQGSAAFWTLANQPSSASVGGITQTALTGSWSASGNPGWTTYQAVLQDPSDGAWLQSPTTTATGYTFVGLGCDTHYDVWVRAENGAGAWTGFTRAGSPYTLPCTPAALAWSSPTQSGFTISWSADGNGSNTSYAVAYEMGGAWHDLPGSTATTSYTFSGLACDATIQNFAVRANDAVGSSPWAYDDGAAFALRPCGVSSVSATVSPSGVLSVSWSAGGNAAGTTYDVEVLNASNATVQGPRSTTNSSTTFAGVCGGGFYAEIQADNPSGPAPWVGSNTVGAPACLSLSIAAPTGYPPGDPNQLNVTVASISASAGSATITQQQLSPSGSVVAARTFSVSVPAGGGGTYTVTDQRSGGAGYVYRYTATMNGQTSNSALFANAPTFYVHRRVRGLFVTFPDEGNGTRYEVFGGPVGTGCGGGGGSFNSGMLPAGTTQWAVGGLSPNTEYGVCMWAQIPGQPVTAGGWLPTWWVSGGKPNASGMWYTLPDVPGRRTAGGLLAAYYDVPSLANDAGPSEQVFGNNPDYTSVQGPIDFAISCNCTASWPYAGQGGPMPTGTAGAGTAQDFSAKYLGWVYAPASGAYTFGCGADDACQVWVDGQPVVDGMTSSGSSPNYYGGCNACSGPAGTISLSAGNWYPLEIDYAQQGGGAQIHFTWTPPGGGSADVPASDLAYPSMSGVPGGAGGNVTISWATNKNPSGTTYKVTQVMLSPAGSASASATLCQSTSASCTTTDLSGATVSEYYASAESGDGYWTPAATEPGGGGYLWADAPQATVHVNSSGSIAVSWPSLGNGAQYAAIWNTSASGGGASNSGALAGSTSYTIGGLQPNTAYYVWVDAWIPEPSGVGNNPCAGGSGGGCYWYGAATYPAWTLANPPSSLALTGASNSLSMSWSANGNPSGTTYDWSATAEGGSSTAATGSVTTDGATASGLVCQSNYEAAVKAVNGAGVVTSAVTATGETGTCSPPPKVALEVDDGLSQTATTAVTLDIQATDANYAQSQLQMRFSNAGSGWSAWQGYAAAASWTLTGAPGPNTVYTEVKDPQGGLGSAIATISYDSSRSTVTAGSGTACTYRGISATCTRSPIVTASFTLPSGSVSMETSLDGTGWSQPQDAQAGVTLVLPTGDGLKAVFARYFNQNDVATPEGPDYFVLDTTAPVIQAVAWLNGAAVTNSGSATLVVQASDNVTPASALQVTVSGAATWSGTLPGNGQIPLTVTGSGYVTIDVEVADQAGNSSGRQLGIYN